MQKTNYYNLFKQKHLFDNSMCPFCNSKNLDIRILGFTKNTEFKNEKIDVSVICNNCKKNYIDIYEIKDFKF
jgi:C4-type Zn-finger protein